MGIAANSYGSTTEVAAAVPHRTTAAGKFTSTTTPTETQVIKFIDRASAILNAKLAALGFDIPVTQADAKLMLDDFVVSRAAMWVDQTGRMSRSRFGSGADASSRRTATGFYQLWKDAIEFINSYSRGLQELGATRSRTRGRGLYAGGISISEVDDFESDTDRVLPSFKRGMMTPAGGSPQDDLQDASEKF